MLYLFLPVDEMRGGHFQPIKEAELMTMSRRAFVGGLAGMTVLARTGSAQDPAAPAVQRYVRFLTGERVVYGLVDQETVYELRGSIFESPARTGLMYPFSKVKLLVPCEPTKVLAVGRNYASHLGELPPPANPELFYKPLTSLLDPEGTIIIPPGTQDCHFEGELVAVIGKKAKNVSVEEAKTCIFGVTCGNDVSARDFQANDMQWWRAKGSDTFGPLGPMIVRGLDYGNLLLTTRLNGEVKQQQSTRDLIFDLPTIVSFTSRYVTLLPGDVIYTGTPGSTSAMKSGDVVEVEIEGIGVLRNTVK